MSSFDTNCNENWGVKLNASKKEERIEKWLTSLRVTVGYKNLRIKLL